MVLNTQVWKKPLFQKCQCPNLGEKKENWLCWKGHLLKSHGKQCAQVYWIWIKGTGPDFAELSRPQLAVLVLNID